MTPEEKAVIDAAIREHRGCAPETCGGTSYDMCRLGDAIENYKLANWKPTGIINEQGIEIVEWVPATIADALAGDRVRLGSSEAVVEGVGPAWHGHVRPGTGTSRANPPMAQEHTLIPIRLAGRKELLHLAPTLAIEILANAERRAMLLLQRGITS